MGAADQVVILLTHAHADHTAGAADLARILGAEVSGPGGERDIDDGETFATSHGELVAISTPGHSRRHFCFQLPRTADVFAGDLILGEGDTTWVGEYTGAVAQYLASLDRLEALRPRVIHPAHGPDILDPAAAIERFRRHRLTRIEMVRSALDAGHTDPAAITRHVYGVLPREVRAMALASVEAILDYLSGAE